MSLLNAIEEMLGPQEGVLSLSPRRRFVNVGNVAIVAGGSAQLTIGFSFTDILNLGDAIFFEHMAGVVTGDAVAATTITLNGFRATLSNSTGGSICELGEGIFTINTLVSTAAISPQEGFALYPTPPLLLANDIAALAALAAVANTQPYQVQVIITGTEAAGGAASHINAKVSCLLRLVSGISEG